MLEERSRRVARVGQGPPGGGAEGAGGAGSWLGPGEADRLDFLIAPLVALLPRSTPPPQPGFISPELGPCSVGWVGAGRGAGGERGLAFSFRAPPLPSQGAGSVRGVCGVHGQSPPRAFLRRERDPRGLGLPPTPEGRVRTPRGPDLPRRCLPLSPCAPGHGGAGPVPLPRALPLFLLSPSHLNNV